MKTVITKEAIQIGTRTYAPGTALQLGSKDLLANRDKVRVVREGEPARRDRMFHGDGIKHG